MSRPDGRRPDQLRDDTDHPRLAGPCGGVGAGRVRRAPACCARPAPPRRCRAGGGAAGWAGSPPSTRCCRGQPTPAVDRESVKGRLGGRTQEISRLVGRSLRACVDAKALGENTIVIDCDVCRPTAAPAPPRSPAGTSRWPTPSSWLQGRRRCKGEPLAASVAAVSVGIVDGEPLLDLCYEEDVARRDRHERGLHRRRQLRGGPGHRRAASRSAGSARPAARSRRGRLRRARAAAAATRSADDGAGAGPARLVLATRNRAQARRAAADPGRRRAERRRCRPRRRSPACPRWPRPGAPSRRTRCSRPGRSPRSPGCPRSPTTPGSASTR